MHGEYDIRADLKVTTEEGPVDEVGTVEVRGGCDAIELCRELCDLSLNALTICVVIGVIRRLDGELTDPLEDVGGLVESTLCGLSEADAVVAVPNCLVEATDLRREACGD